MDGDDLARLGYLALLLAAVGGWVVVEYRRRLGFMLRQAAAWGLIFLGLIAVWGLWQDIRTDLLPGQSVAVDGQRIELPRAPDGHYYLGLEIGGVTVRFMVDTGASNVVLSNRDAERLGIDRSRVVYTGEARTANGVIRTARVMLRDVRLQGRDEGNLPAVVGDGDLGLSLLGMDYLRRFQRVEIAGNRLVLVR
jgi:aspartyl protease family protein